MVPDRGARRVLEGVLKGCHSNGSFKGDYTGRTVVTIRLLEGYHKLDTAPTQ